MTTHGMSSTPTYGSWMAMKNRCNNPKDIGYALYGGRGIKVCARWLNSFENFYADMGERPAGKSLDRIDNDRGYSPKNCRWATPKEQSNNTSYVKRAIKGYSTSEIEPRCVASADTIRRIARQNPGIGRKVGGRWVFSQEDIRKINGVGHAEYERKRRRQLGLPDEDYREPYTRARRAAPSPATDALPQEPTP